MRFLCLVGILRRDDSSIDSLERECMYNSENDSSPKLKSCHHLSPTNLSRDSGLMLSDTQLNDEEPTSLDLNFMERDFDQIVYEPDNGTYDKFYGNDAQNPVPPPRRKYGRSKHETRQTSPNFNSHRAKQYIHRYEKRSGSGQSMPMEASRHHGKRMSTESLKSVEEGSEGSSDRDFHWRGAIDMGTLIKSASGAHLYIQDDLRISNLDFNRTKPCLPHQSSATDSTPPLSPESKYSVGSSQDSVLTDSSASFLNSQFSREGITPPHTPDSDTNVTSWVNSSQIHNSSQDRLLHSHDDSSVHLRSHAKLKNSPSAGLLHKPSKNMRFYVSTPTLHQEIENVPEQVHGHKKVSVRNSVPMNLDVTPSRSVSHEAEDIMTPQKLIRTFGSSESLARDVNEENPLTLPPPFISSTPSLGVFKPSAKVTPRQTPNFVQLGMSPPGRVLLNSLNSSNKNTPAHADYDKTLPLQGRRHSFDNVYENTSQQKDSMSSENSIPKKVSKIKISSKRGVLSQPKQRYQTEVTLSPLKISIPINEHKEQPELDMSVKSALGKTANEPRRPIKPPSYFETVQRQYFLQQGFPLEIGEQDSKVQKVRSARAKQLYEDSLQQYQQTAEVKPKYSRTNHHLNRTLFMNDHMIEELEEENGSEQQKEEGVYVTLAARPDKDPRRVYMDSLMNYVEEKKSIMPVVSGNEKKQTSDSKEKSNLVSQPNLHRSFSDSADRVEKAKEWHHKAPLESPKKHADASVKQTVHGSHDTDSNHHNFPQTSSHKHSNTDQRTCAKTSTEQSRSRPPCKEFSTSSNKDSSQDVTISVTSKSASDKRTPTELSHLPWSVKNLRSMWDNESSGNGQNVRHSTSSLPRPPPPPYNPPPPFRRLSDTNRLSSSSNSSLSSSGTDHSALSSKQMTLRRGGPQSMDSFSSVDSVESCGQYFKRQELSISDELVNYTDVTYV